jgi:hypothetical protein
MKRNKIKIIKRAYKGMKIDESSLLIVELKDYIPKIVDEKYDSTPWPPNSHESIDYLSSSLDCKKSTSFTERSTREPISQLLFIF